MSVTLNEDARQFEIRTDGGLALLAYYRKANKIAYVHTEVPESMEGQGIGGDLAKAALEYAKENGLRVYPFCPFVRSYIKRHPEYEALTEPLDEW